MSDVYVRKATGLVRAFSWRDIFALNTLCLNIGVVLALSVLSGAQMFPGANMAATVTLGMILCIFNGMTYALMAAAMPRSGGDYVWVSHIISPVLGFVISWAFVANVMFAIGMYAGMTANFAVSATFVTLGAIMNQSWLTDIGSAAATANWTFLIGTFAIWISVAVFTLGTRAIRWFLWALFIPSMLGVLIGLAVFLTTSHETFVSLFNSYMSTYTGSPDSYNLILATAKEAGATFPVATIGATVGALPLGYWAYVGFSFSAYYGGEVKEPGRSQPLGIVSALLVAWAVYAAMFWKFYDTVGLDFTNAISYL